MIQFESEITPDETIYNYLLELESEILKNRPKFIKYNIKPNDLQTNLIAVFNKQRFLNYKIENFNYKSEEITYFVPYIYENDLFGVSTIINPYDIYIILDYDVDNNILIKKIKRNQHTKHPIDICIEIKQHYDKGFKKKKIFKNYNDFIQMSTAIIHDDYATVRYDENFFNINEFDYEKYGVSCEFNGTSIIFKLKNNPFPLIEPYQGSLNKYIKNDYINSIRNFWYNKCYILKKEDLPNE